MNLLITGATKGIGKAIVELFAQNGWNVYFCARTEADVISLEETLKSSYPQQQFIGFIADISQKEEVVELGKKILNHCDSIDVLVNNAGIFIPGNISDEPDGMLEMQLQTNLMSAYHLTRQLLPTLIKQGKSHIFNMCSVASLKAYPNGGAYSISKYALLGFSENLRYELMDKNIKVTAVMPGATMSDSWSGSDINPQRIMEANDIALAVYNATQLSSQAVVESIVIRPQLGDL